MNPISRQRIKEYSERLSRGEVLDDAEFAMWREVMASSPEARKAYLLECELEAAVGDAVQDGVLARRPSGIPRRMPRRSSFGLGLAAAAAVVIGLGVWWFGQRSDMEPGETLPSVAEASTSPVAEKVDAPTAEQESPDGSGLKADSEMGKVSLVSEVSEVRDKSMSDVPKPAEGGSSLEAIASDHKGLHQDLEVSMNPTHPEKPKSLGQVTAAHDVSGWGTGKGFLSGDHALASGTVELKLNTGVRLVFVGPAKFSIDSGMALRLIHGQMSAEVLPSAVGFQVITEKVSVVDYGTRFAVTADEEGDTAVHVFDGMVTAGTGLEEAGEPLFLESEDTVRTAKTTGELEVVEFDPELFAPKPAWNGGVAWLSESVEWLEEAPRDATEMGMPEGKSRLFRESERVRLRRDLEVNIDARGDESEGGRGSELLVIPRGSQVTSYLLHAHYAGDRSRGELSFDSPILGIIYRGEWLSNTDRDFGARRTDYPEHSKRRGTEEGENGIQLDGDRRTVRFSLNAPTIDQIRILVAHD